MKLKALVLLSLLYVTNLNAQVGSWVTKQHLNNDLIGRDDAGMVSLNGKLYIVGGYNGCGPKDFTRYTPSTGKFEKLKNIGTSCSNGFNGACLFAVQGKIYSITGNGVKAYDTLQNTWTTVAAGLATLTPDAGFVVNDTIFVTSQTGNNFFAFNTTSNTFSQRANLPGQIVSDAFAFSLNGKGYWGGGVVYNVGETSAFYEYDPANNSWTPKTGVPRTIGFGVATADNSKGYVGLGTYYTSGGSLKSQYWHEYDPIGNVWTTKQNFMNLPSGNTNSGIKSAACAMVSNDVFVFGGAYHGYNNLYIDDIYKFNTVANNWDIVNSEPGGNRTEAAGFHHNGKIYTGGGQDSEPLKDFWEYDIATNQWAIKANFGSTYGQRAAAELNGKGYFVGGYQLGSFYIDSLLEYNPATNVFTAKASFPGGVRGRMVALTYNGQLYAGMGTNTSGYNWADFYRYDPNTNTWTTLTAVPFVVGDGQNLKSFVIGDTAYILTGASTTHFYKYSFLSNSWSSSTVSAATINDYNSMDYSNQACTFNGKGYIVTGTATATDCIVEYTPATGTWKQIVNVPNKFGSRTVIPTSNGIYLGFGEADTYTEFGVRRTNMWTELIFNAPISAQTGIYKPIWINGGSSICGTDMLAAGVAHSVYDSAGHLFAAIVANTTTSSTCIEVNSLDTLLPYRERCGQFGFTANESGMYLNKSVLATSSIPGTATLRLYYTNAELNKFVLAFNTKYGTNKTIDSIKLLIYYGNSTIDHDPLNNNVPGGHTIKNPTWVNYSNGKYVDLTGNGGISGEVYAVLTVPAPSATITGPSSVCAGSSVTLTAAGGDGYAWSNGLGNTALVTASPTGSVTYTVSVSAANNLCTSTATKTITINALPTATLTGTNAICNGASTTLTASGGVRYTWSSSADTIATQSVSPSSTTTYTVTVTNANNCSATATKSLTVNSVTAAISGPTSICTGTSAQLTASGGTYSWSNGLGTNAQVTVTPTTATTYTVTVTNSGCTATASQTVQVAANPTASIAGNTSVCPGSSTTLTANGGNSYTWGNGLGTNADITVNPTAATTYTVTVSLGANCTATASQTVTIKQPTSGQVAQSICTGSSFTFNGQALTQGGTYMDTLINAAGCDSIVTLTLTEKTATTGQIARTFCTGSSYTFNGQALTQEGTYADTLVNATGCDSILTLTLTETPAATGSFAQTICRGSAFVFNGSSLTQDGVYLDTLTASTTCDSIVTLTLSVEDLPVPTVTQIGNALSTQAYSAYQWLLNNAPINGATGQNHNATVNGNYAVIATNAAGCADTSNVVNVTGVGVQTLRGNAFAIDVYPNPNNGKFTIAIAEPENADMQLYNAMGELVASIKLKNATTQAIDPGYLAAGVYTLSIRGLHGICNKRIVIQ